MEKHPNNCRTYTWPDIRSNHFVDQKPNTYHFVDRDVTFITTKNGRRHGRKKHENRTYRMV